MFAAIRPLACDVIERRTKCFRIDQEVSHGRLALRLAHSVFAGCVEPGGETLPLFVSMKNTALVGSVDRAEVLNFVFGICFGIVRKLSKIRFRNRALNVP